MRQIPCTTSSTRLVFKFVLTSFNCGLPVTAYLGELVSVHIIWVCCTAPLKNSFLRGFMNYLDMVGAELLLFIF